MIVLYGGMKWLYNANAATYLHGPEHVVFHTIGNPKLLLAMIKAMIFTVIWPS